MIYNPQLILNNYTYIPIYIYISGFRFQQKNPDLTTNPPNPPNPPTLHRNGGQDISKHNSLATEILRSPELTDLLAQLGTLRHLEKRLVDPRTDR